MEFDFAQGTDFEKKVMKWLWGVKNKSGGKATDLCKPDIYDVRTNTMIEAKYTRPYYDKDPNRFTDAKDLGTGLPKNQYNRYVKMRDHGIKVVFIHKMSEGKYRNKIFISELDDELVSKAKKSDGGNTIYWAYSDLTIKNNLNI